MIAALCIILGVPCLPAATAHPAATADTIRLEVGSKEVNAGYFAPHAARVRVRIDSDTSAVVSEWINELTVGDSAGRKVHRWVTLGTQTLPNGQKATYELRQTYDAVTLAPYGYNMTSSSGAFTRLTLDGRRVRGTRRLPNDTTVQQVDVTLDRPGFVAGASDLVPLAAGFAPGKVMTAPMWAPNMTRSELRVFTVVSKGPVMVEGTRVDAWKVEERRHADRQLLATWYLVEEKPYMVYGEVPMADGRIRRMSEVEVPMANR